MIRVVLLGRTGNHLFQYALGRVLSRKHGVALVMDASWFNAEGWREVSHFLSLPLKARVVRRLPLASRALRKFAHKHYWEFRCVPVLREPGADQSYDSTFVNAPADCVLYGYFQSPLYFQEIEDEFRTELNTLFASTADDSPGLCEMLRGPASVAVHVRRKDYLIHDAFQVCDRTYYRNAMAKMRAAVPGARFWIFSDDPDWCRAEFREADEVVVDSGNAGGNPLHDLRLMSLASHHIIANSTYSWWAAWLAKHPGQKVLMPDRWYAHGIKAPIEEKKLPHWEIVG